MTKTAKHTPCKEHKPTSFVYGCLNCNPTKPNEIKKSMRIAYAFSEGPALLKALKEMVAVEWDQDPESRNQQDSKLRQYEKLIAKAEGK